VTEEINYHYDESSDIDLTEEINYHYDESSGIDLTEELNSHHDESSLSNSHYDESSLGSTTCELGYQQLACSSGDECISIRSRCDGVADCSDASDEKDCNYTLDLRTYPTHQTVAPGRDVVFDCRDEGEMRADVVWRREDDEQDDDNHQQNNHQPLPPGSRDERGRLELYRVEVGDAGRYVCYAARFLHFRPPVVGGQASVVLNVTDHQM